MSTRAKEKIETVATDIPIPTLSLVETKIRSVGSIFGPRADLIIFPLTMMVGFVLGISMPQYQTGFLAFVFASETHSFTTFFFIFGSKIQMSTNGRRYLLYLFSSLIFFVAVHLRWGPVVTAQVFVLATIFHFARQQCAWFFISAKRSAKIGNVENWINRGGIWAATYGFALMYMADPEQIGWFIYGDLPELPEFLLKPLYLVISALLLVYVVFHAAALLQKKFVPWRQHMFFACTAIAWGCSLIFYIPYVLALMHSVPYLYLSLGYVKHKTETKEELYLPKLNPKNMVSFVVLFSVGIAVAEWYSGRIIYFIWAAIAMTHYLIDGYFWKSKNNPDGRSFLDSFKS